MRRKKRMGERKPGLNPFSVPILNGVVFALKAPALDRTVHATLFERAVFPPPASGPMIFTG
jgi:hypothetical protein